MAEITPFIGAFARLTIAPKMLAKMFTIFCHAAPQFPENTFSTNWMRLKKIAFTFSAAADTLLHQPER